MRYFFILFFLFASSFFIFAEGGSITTSICGINPTSKCPISLKKFDLEIKDFLCAPDCAFSLQDLADVIDPHLQRAKTCTNGGMYNTTSQSCSCPYGYTGDSCETYLGVCMDKECFNGGKCDIIDGTCHCTKGYAGGSCERKVFCPTANFDWTENGCKCKPNFIGTNCDTCDPNLICLPDISESTDTKFILGRVSDTKVSQFLLSAPSTPSTKDLKPFKPSPLEHKCVCSVISSSKRVAPIKASSKESTHRLLENIVSNRLFTDDEGDDFDSHIDYEYPTVFLHHLYEHHHHDIPDDCDDDSATWVIVLLVLLLLLIPLSFWWCCSPNGYMHRYSMSQTSRTSELPSTTPITSHITKVGSSSHSSRKKSRTPPVLNLTKV